MVNLFTLGKLAKAVIILLHVDTGSHYRTMTHALLEAEALTQLATPLMVLSLLDQMIFQTRIDGQQAQLEIHEQIPHSKRTLFTQSKSGGIYLRKFYLKGMPAALFDYQREQKEIAQQNNFAGLVMEGR